MPARLPVVAIVGRPNTGKSSLFNLLAGRRLAIVDALPGVTRDRLAATVELEGGLIELVDTGGLGGPNPAAIAAAVEEQIELALQQADLLLFLCDGREGPTALDREVARRLRPLGKPVLLAVNKLDEPNQEAALAEFHALGCGAPLPLSVHQFRGTDELRQALAARLPARGAPAPGPEEPEMLLALVGKRNAGKSTLLNTLAGERRVVVSELPGTTRDAVDVRLQPPGETPYTVIDTAGMRLERSFADPLEFYSLVRTREALERAHVALLLLDATSPVSRPDKQLAEAVREEGKATIIAVNKWDLAPEADTGRYSAYLRRVLPGLARAPVAFLSAARGLNVRETIALARELFAQSGRRVGTAAVNAALADAVRQQGPPPEGGRVPRLLYATQIGVRPPTLLIFARHPSALGRNYLRYLAGALADRLGFPEVPLRLILRARPEKEWRPPAPRGAAGPETKGAPESADAGEDEP